MEHEIASLNDSIQQKTEALDTLSKAIHEKRVEAVPVLSQKLISILETLGMPNVRFKMDLNMSLITISKMEKTNFSFCFLPIKEPISAC